MCGTTDNDVFYSSDTDALTRASPHRPLCIDVVQACKHARDHRQCVVQWRPRLWRCQAKLSSVQRVHRPGIEPGSHRWQRCILPLDHRCNCARAPGQPRDLWHHPELIARHQMCVESGTTIFRISSTTWPWGNNNHHPACLGQDARSVRCVDQ